MNSDEMLLALLFLCFSGGAVTQFYSSLNSAEFFVFVTAMVTLLVIAFCFVWEGFSKTGRERKKRLDFIRQVPSTLLIKDDQNVLMGTDQNLQIPIYLPDLVRSKHVHILGATGSGKTESVILNFLRQDVARGRGSIILDAKGDDSFLAALESWVPEDRRRVFDLGTMESSTYDPLEAGSPIEAAQRLFLSLTWSEEYYKSKANSTLQSLFEIYHQTHGKNPTLRDLLDYLEDSEIFTAATISESYPVKLAERDFAELSGLRDQIRALCISHLAKILSPKDGSQIRLEDATKGCVIYFRLQSLLSPQIVSTLGKLLINHLSFLAGTAHRDGRKKFGMIPIYLDEFASFACPEFRDLISKARSANFALHFSHQSIGDLADLNEGFLNSITDNASTKIVLRINDPDSAEFFARSFGTELYQKMTHRITNAKETDFAEIVGEGTQREAHRFRASPDLFKSLPTGVGSVLIAHGEDTPHGASTVFKIKFPKLDQEERK